MLSKKMIDLNADLPQRGSIYFWKFKTDGWLGSEWQFSADEEGRGYFLELVERLLVSSETCRLVLTVTPVTADILRACDFDGAYENRTQLKLMFWPSDAHADTWLVSDNEKIVDMSFGRTILENWRRLLVDAPGEECSLGLGEDHVIFIW